MIKPILYDPGHKYQGRYFHFRYTLQALSGVKGKILDIGCGSGDLTHALKIYRPDLEVYACDKDKCQLALFTKRYGDQGIKLLQANAYQLPAKKQEFEAVLISDVLEHLSQSFKALREAARVLKKGGIFHLTVPLEGDLVTIDGWLKLLKINLKEKPIGHIQQFELAEIREMVRKLGLKITQVRFSHHFFYQLFSLFYYLYVALLKRGQYLSLATENKSVNWLMSLLENIAGHLTYWESSLFSQIKGQTVHITAKKM